MFSKTSGRIWTVKGKVASIIQEEERDRLQTEPGGQRAGKRLNEKNKRTHPAKKTE